MKKEYKNTLELIWILTKTDFALRYQGSVLGYVWALLKPLLLFIVLNFVFSSLFSSHASGATYYSLQLLTGILLFNFFSEGTMAGLTSLVAKSALVTKVFIPRWIIVLASTLNSLLIFLANMVILAGFFIGYGLVPSIAGLATFLLYILLLYILIVGFSLITAPGYARFRDISMIWEVLLSIIMYASPIIYPLSLMSPLIQKIILMNPVAFIIYFAKQALIFNHYPELMQVIGFTSVLVAFFLITAWLFKKTARNVAEYL